MKKLFRYPSIERYSSAIKEVTRLATFIGKDETGQPMYDDSIRKPMLTFHGTVKLHGTNSSVCWNKVDGMWVQSHNKIITPEDDNAGFAKFVESNIAVFKTLLNTLMLKNNLSVEDSTVVALYGEWAGKGINGGVGISKLEKSFFIFGAQKAELSDQEEFCQCEWLDIQGLSRIDNGIYNISDFKTFIVNIDFENPEASSKELEELTVEVEKRCPVAYSLGQDGIGEGIVWYTDYCNNRIFFKVKGDKHTVVATKNLVTTDVEKLASIKDFVDYAVTDNRLTQAINEVLDKPEEVSIRDTGNILKWMHQDISKEETETLEANNLEWKEVIKAVTQRTIELLNKRV